MIKIIFAAETNYFIYNFRLRIILLLVTNTNFGFVERNKSISRKLRFRVKTKCSNLILLKSIPTVSRT